MLCASKQSTHPKQKAKKNVWKKSFKKSNLYNTY